MRLVSLEVLRLLSHVPSSRPRKRACTKTAMGSAPRYQRHSWSDDPAELPTAVSELMQVCPVALSNAVKLIENGLAVGEGFSGGSEYTGLTGIAHAYLHIHETLCRQEQLPQILQGLVAASESLLLKATEMVHVARASPQRVTFLEGMAGVLCIRAAAYKAQDRDQKAKLAAVEVKQWGAYASHLPPGECELLYGRAGYLYCLLFLHKHITPMLHDEAQLVGDLVEQIVREGRGHPLAAEYGGLMYSWHGSAYLGGILHTLALAQRHFGEHDLCPGVDLVALIKSSTFALIDHAFPSMNLPSGHGSDTDKLVHWCHGATGFLPLLLEVEGLCRGAEAARVRAAAEAASQVIWERGLLLKGPGLCHGVSGNGYALLSAYKHTQDAHYLVRAVRFATWLAEHWQELYGYADRPLSLFEGISGAVYFWADTLAVSLGEHELDRIYFPGYEV